MENQAAAASPNFLRAASAYLATLKNCKVSGCLLAEEAPPPSPVTAAFTYAPAQPTDATPITFTGTGDGVPPYTFTWDLGGQPAAGETVTKTFPRNLRRHPHRGRWFRSERHGYPVSRGWTLGGHHLGEGAHRPTSVGSVRDGGSNPMPVAINGSAAMNAHFKRSTKVVAKDSGLKAMVPRGVSVMVTVTNPNGAASAPFPFTR